MIAIITAVTLGCGDGRNSPTNVKRTTGTVNKIVMSQSNCLVRIDYDITPMFTNTHSEWHECDCKDYKVGDRVKLVKIKD